jgi:hypothetical protein
MNECPIKHGMEFGAACRDTCKKWNRHFSLVLTVVHGGKQQQAKLQYEIPYLTA